MYVSRILSWIAIYLQLRNGIFYASSVHRLTFSGRGLWKELIGSRVEIFQGINASKDGNFDCIRNIVGSHPQGMGVDVQVVTLSITPYIWNVSITYSP